MQVMVSAFNEAGYFKLLMAVGDHEVGDNSWPPGTAVSKHQAEFREAFANVFNDNPDGGQFIYDKPIGEAASRPLGTKYETTSYAYQHKNVLFVTVDVFYQENPDRKIGMQGSVTGAAVGKHLNVVGSGLVRSPQGRQHQAHLRSIPSDLVQVVTHGRNLNNFAMVNATDEEIDISLYNQIAPKPTDGKYEASGRLVVDKSADQKTFRDEGELTFLDRQARLIHFDFEENFAFRDRQILGFSIQSGNPLKSDITIEGIICDRSFANQENSSSITYYDENLPATVAGRSIWVLPAKVR